jgi:hypothetical protein
LSAMVTRFAWPLNSTAFLARVVIEDVSSRAAEIHCCLKVLH